MLDPKTLALGDLDHELKLTRLLLAAIPGDRLDWRPHQKSMTIGGLGIHLGNIPMWQTGTLRESEFDLSTLPRRVDPPKTTDDILANFDRNAATAREAMEALDADALDANWTLRHGEKVFFTRPRFVVLRDMGISHMVHHRGQLSVYLRLLDVPVPSTYGPTADSQPDFA